MFNLLERYILSRTDVSEQTLRVICQYFRPLQARRNEILLEFDAVCGGYYFVNEGCLRLFTYNAEGLETTRYFGFKGEFCTALPSFIQQTSAGEYLQAISKSQLLYTETFYPFVDVVFQIQDEKHYHVPITLSAFGYATYRGN